MMAAKRLCLPILLLCQGIHSRRLQLPDALPDGSVGNLSQSDIEDSAIDVLTQGDGVAAQQQGDPVAEYGDFYLPQS